MNKHTVGVETPPIRRLHWRLTLLYVLVSGVAVTALAMLVARSDAHLRDVQLNAHMQSRVQAATGLVYFENGQAEFSDLSEDQVATGSPQVAVLLGAPPSRRAFATAEPPLTLSTEQLLPVARKAVSEEEIVTAAPEGDGQQIRLMAEPLYDDAGVLAGAVVAVGDPAPGAAEHRKLLVALALGCGGLLLLTGIGGHLLAGRSMGSAVDSLEHRAP
jgi:two-component system OmpR family sensor kinase